MGGRYLRIWPKMERILSLSGATSSTYLAASSPLSPICEQWHQHLDSFIQSVVKLKHMLLQSTSIFMGFMGWSRRVAEPFFQAQHQLLLKTLKSLVKKTLLVMELIGMRWTDQLSCDIINSTTSNMNISTTLLKLLNLKSYCTSPLMTLSIPLMQMQSLNWMHTCLLYVTFLIAGSQIWLLYVSYG